MGTGTRTRPFGPRIAVGLLMALSSALLVVTAPDQLVAQTAPTATFSASATGTILHADVLDTGTTRLVNADVAMANAVAGSATLTAATNELQRVVVPSTVTGRSFGRGTPLEIGLGVSPAADGQLVLAGRADAQAPASTELVRREVPPINVNPLVYASLLRGESRALAEPDVCGLVGSNLAQGKAYVADVQLLNSGQVAPDQRFSAPVVALDAPSVERAVSQTFSHSMLIPQVNATGTLIGDDFGVMSEVRQTIAPVTLFRGTANQLTIEVLGEWVLRVASTGLAGGSWFWYGPAAVSPQTPILRMINAAGVVTQQLTFQQLLNDPEGLSIVVPDVLELTIGEDPRLIGGTADDAPVIAANGTSAAAAVDVVRLRLLPDASTSLTHAADVRLGHMEAQTAVSSGGIACPLPVSKAASPASVRVGEQFVTTITVNNHFDCPVQQVAVTDDVTLEGGAAIARVSEDPAADTFTGVLPNLAYSWNDVGPIAANGTKAVRVTQRATDGPGQGVDLGAAQATLKCPADSALGEVRLAGTAIDTVAVAGGTDDVTVVVAQASPTPTASPTAAPTASPTASPSATATARPTPTTAVLPTQIVPLPRTGSDVGFRALIGLTLLLAGILLVLWADIRRLRAISRRGAWGAWGE